MKTEDQILVFLNKVTPRIGPVNAINLLRDTRANALQEMIQKLGMPIEQIEEINNRHMNQQADNIVKNVPVVSPIQKHP